MDSIEKMLRKHNRLCWYPSAGADFRVLLFLSQQYVKRNNISISTEELPDLFILTDCNPNDTSYVKHRGWSDIDVLNSNDVFNIGEFKAYCDECTIISAHGLRNIGCIDAQCDEKFYCLGKSGNYGCAFLFNAHIVSNKLGVWDTDVLYILTENTWFALRYLIPRSIFIDYIVRVRYGDKFGGSVLPGEWLIKLIPHLNTKYFLSTEPEDVSNINEFIQSENNYSDLKCILNMKEEFDLVDIYSVDEYKWSRQGDIHWYKVIQ